MKKVRDYHYFDIVILLFELVIFIIVITQNSVTFKGIIIPFLIFILTFIFLGKGHFVFQYNDKQINIYNSWLPINEKTYNLTEIEGIEKINAAYRGGGVRIKFKNGTQKLFFTSIKKKDLKKALEEISKCLPN